METILLGNTITILKRNYLVVQDGSKMDRRIREEIFKGLSIRGFKSMGL